MPTKYLLSLLILVLLSLLILVLLSVACASASTNAPASVGAAAAPGATIPQTVDPYDIGSPTLTDIWVDPVNGDDSRSGESRSLALRTINAAWQRIPTGALTGTGYRMQLVAGTYSSGLPNYWENRQGSRDFPVILNAVDGAGTAEIQGNLNVYDVDYFYLLGVTVRNDGDVFHCELCDYLLLRQVTMDGGPRQAHETVKVNQSQYVHIEESDIFGSYENAIDFVAVQYGHILNNRIHAADDWCIYLKGGSAYFRVEGNEIYDCGTGGFVAGQGTGFEYMTSPWLHYEAYAIQFVNNLVHDTEGAGFGVNGGYDILFAYNTLYRVGSRSHGLEFVFGRRSCDGDGPACAARQSAGGWGPAVVGGDEPIPNRNIYVYNNLLYNPPGFQSQWQHFAVYSPRTPNSGSNVPSPAVADDNLRIRGNLIWNGPTDLALGVGDGEGCASANPTCNLTQLLADNAINTVEPQLVNPVGGNFRPVAGGNVYNAVTFPIPAFPAWDALTPAAPVGELTNSVPVDRENAARAVSGPPGAYEGSGQSATTATSTPTLTSTPTASATHQAATQSRLHLPQVARGATATRTATALATRTATALATATATATPTTTPTSTGGSNLPPGPVTLVMLGDSLTAGDGDDSAEGGGYPRRLLESVQARRSGSTATNLGRSGWTAGDLVNGVNGEAGQLGQAVALLNGAGQSAAKAAFLWIGSNDLWYLYEFGPEPMTAGAESEDLQNFSANLDKLLTDLRATGATVFVGLLDDQSLRPVVADPPNPSEPAFPGITADDSARMSAQVTRYNDAIRARAAQRGAVVVDFFATTIFTSPTTLAGDGNHPNGAGYDIITGLWWAALDPRLP